MANIISTELFKEFGGTGGPEGNEVSYRMEYIPATLIDAHPENREIDSDYVAELAESIKRDGLGQLPLVRQMPGGRYQMIAGHHRMEALLQKARDEGEAAWRATMIPCNIVEGFDDGKARVMLHVSNLVSSRLSAHEEGRAYDEIDRELTRRREADPEKFAGTRNAEIISEIAGQQGRSVSARTVNRRLNDYRKDRAKPRDRTKKPARRDGAEIAADSLHRAVERVESLGKSDPASVARQHDRLVAYARRIQSAADKAASKAGKTEVSGDVEP